MLSIKGAHAFERSARKHGTRVNIRPVGLVAAAATATARGLTAGLANGNLDLLLIGDRHAVALHVLHDFRLALIDAALDRVRPLFLLHHAHGNLDFPVLGDLLHDAALDRVRSLLLLHHADGNRDLAVLGDLLHDRASDSLGVGLRLAAGIAAAGARIGHAHGHTAGAADLPLDLARNAFANRDRALLVMPGGHTNRARALFRDRVGNAFANRDRPLLVVPGRYANGARVLLTDHVADDAVNGAAHFSLAPLGPKARDGPFLVGDLGLAANRLAARGLATAGLTTASLTAIAAATTAAAAVTRQGGAGDQGRQATREDEGQQLAHGCSSG